MSLRQSTFSESDWTALAPYWYPVAFSHEVSEKPIAVQLLDERLVLYRLANGKVTAARDLCLHRGVPLSMGLLEGDALVCAYHGFRYDGEGRCVCIPAHPGGAIPPKLKLQTYPTQERYGLVWTRLVNDGPRNLPEFEEWLDPDHLQVLPNSEDIELDGHLLRKGSRLQLGIGAANHDPAEFPNPEQLDFTRPKVNSLAFGYGPHFCLGAALARMETQVALSSLLDRIPNVQLGTRHFEYRPLYFLRALKSLPIRLK